VFRVNDVTTPATRETTKLARCIESLWRIVKIMITSHFFSFCIRHHDNNHIIGHLQQQQQQQQQHDQ
jgi:hypothetical protein